MVPHHHPVVDVRLLMYWQPGRAIVELLPHVCRPAGVR